MGVGLTVGVFALLVLFHAAYSTIRYRGLLKITEEEFSGPPFNVVIELLLGLLLCFWAALTVPGKFLSIHPHSEENRLLLLLSLSMLHSTQLVRFLSYNCKLLGCSCSMCLGWDNWW